MFPPAGTKTLTLSNSIVWIENGIVFSVPSEHPPADMDRQQIREEMDRLRGFLGHRKACIVTRSDPRSRPPAKELRDFIAEELSSITRAMAIVTDSPLSKMIANLFFSFKPPAYPFKFFSSEAEAVAWIKQYC